MFLLALALSLPLEIGWQADGKPTPFWRKAAPAAVHKKFPQEMESSWLDEIRKALPDFAKQLTSLEIPFQKTGKPDSFSVVVGNQGGQDGFTCSMTHICLDLSKWVSEYGEPKADAQDRILRILAHEYTHLLTRRRLERFPYRQKNELLFQLYYEGLGHYYSLSPNWISKNGKLTEKASTRLEELKPILLKNIRTGTLAPGLSEGPFDKKWGAVPVALWLSVETKRDPTKLRAWVEKGPDGILELIRKYLTY